MTANQIEQAGDKLFEAIRDFEMLADADEGFTETQMGMYHGILNQAIDTLTCEANGDFPGMTDEEMEQVRDLMGRNLASSSRDEFPEHLDD